MAKINKQEIIQKLVDELNLYPGKDLIPSELADKILAVYQINTQDITVKNPIATVIASQGLVDASGTPYTFYTTPATGKFYLTNVSLSASTKVLESVEIAVNVIIDGASKKVLLGIIASQNIDQHNTNLTYNLQNPVLIDPGTIITLSFTGSGRATANIIGYTEA